MHGYIRRKVTRNIGAGGNSTPSEDTKTNTNEMHVMGKSENPRERFLILDSMGTMEVSKEFVRSHPSWYTYVGNSRVNGDTFHTFRFIE